MTGFGSGETFSWISCVDMKSSLSTALDSVGIYATRSDAACYVFCHRMFPVEVNSSGKDYLLIVFKGLTEINSEGRSIYTQSKENECLVT